MAKKSKKKVLALPVRVEDEDMVLLLEPGDEIITVPPEELRPRGDEDGTEEPPEPEEPTGDEDAGGFGSRLKAKLPTGGGDEPDEEPGEPDEEAIEPEPETADEDSGGFGDRLKAKLPIGGGDEPDEEPGEPDEEAIEPEPETADEDSGGFGSRLKAKLPIGGGDEPDEEPEETEEAVEPEPEEPDEEAEPEPEIPTETIGLEDSEVDVETLGASGTGLSEVEIGDEPRPVTLDPIPYEPAPAATGDEPEPEEPGLDPGLVDKIRYNVDMAIYRTAKERRERAVEDPRAAVDEVIAGAETEPEPQPEPPGQLPSIDTGIETVPGIDDAAAGKLREAGVETITDLVERDDVSLAVDTDLRVRDIRDWKQIAELLHVPGLEPRHAEILTQVGINRVDLLADQDPDDLRKRVVQYLKYREHEPGADVTTATTRDWIDSAGEVRQGA